MAGIPSSLQRLFGPLTPFLDDVRLQRLIVRRAGEAIVERANAAPQRVVVNLDDATLLSTLEAMAQKAGKTFDAQHPAVEAMLRDGTRFLGLRPPVSAAPALVVTRPAVGVPHTVKNAWIEAALAAGDNLLWAEAGARSWPGFDGTEAVFVGPIDEPAPAGVARLTPYRGAERQVGAGELLVAVERMRCARAWIAEPRLADAWEVVSHLSARRVPLVVQVAARTPEAALLRLRGLATSGAPQRAAGVDDLLASGIDAVVVVRDGVVVALAQVEPTATGPKLVAVPMPVEVPKAEPPQLRPELEPEARPSSAPPRARPLARSSSPAPEVSHPASKRPRAMLSGTASIEAEVTDSAEATDHAEDSIDIEIDLSMVSEEPASSVDEAPVGAPILAPPSGPLDGDDPLHALLQSLGAGSADLDPDEDEEESTTMITEVADEVGDAAAAALANRTFSQILRTMGGEPKSSSSPPRSRHTVVHADED